MNCHHGPLFSDGQFHNVGLSYYGRKAEDLGRYRVTGKAEDVGRFRTPSLRDVTNTEPLMHNGLFRLSGVLNMYNAGMPTPKRRAYQENDPLFPRKSPHLQPLNLTQQELADLAAFLATLAEPYRRIRPPSPADGP
jgi:cytochrome c peroxidase